LWFGQGGAGRDFWNKKAERADGKKMGNLDGFIKRFKGIKLFAVVHVAIVHILPTE
jgi:hypothetical protein